MYSFDQLKNLLMISSHIFMVFVVLNITMWVTNSLAPDFLSVPKQFFGVDFVKQNFRKVQDLKAYYRDDLKDDGEDYPLVVFMGLSGASEGIAVKALQQGIEKNTNILSLSGAGRNIKEIGIYAEPLIDSGLVPKLVIFAISPFHLMEPPPDDRNVLTVLKQTPKHHLLAGWFVIKRDDLRHLIDMQALKTRMALFDAFDYRIGPENLKSWQQDTLMGMRQLQGAHEWEARLEEYGKRGYYQLKNFQNSQNQVALFADLIKTFKKQSSKVIILLMPEHSSLSDKIPDQALPELLGLLGQHFTGSEAPRILDYRQAVSDSGFTDISHLNDSGRETFTRLLRRLLARESAN